jgi:uncharacterized membrane protein
MMLVLGSAAGLLVWWGGDELVRSEPIPFLILVHHGNLVAVLIALTVTIVAAAAALLVRWDHEDDAHPRVVAVTPVIILTAAAVFVFLLVIRHNHGDGLRLVAPHLRGSPAVTTSLTIPISV